MYTCSVHSTRWFTCGHAPQRLWNSQTCMILERFYFQHVRVEGWYKRTASRCRDLFWFFLRETLHHIVDFLGGQELLLAIGHRDGNVLATATTPMAKTEQPFLRGDTSHSICLLVLQENDAFFENLEHLATFGKRVGHIWHISKTKCIFAML